MKIIPCVAFILLWVTIGGADDLVSKKLKQLVVPSLQLVDTPLSDALAFVQEKSVELDPAGSGVNIVILDPKLRDNRVTLKLKNASLEEVLRYTALLGGGQIKKTRFAVTVSSRPGTVKSGSKRLNEKLEARLKSMVFPSLEFYETSIVDAIEFLAGQSGELDPRDSGINFVYHGDREVEGQKKVTLRLSNIPLYEVLGYLTQLSGHRFSIERNAVVVSPM